MKVLYIANIRIPTKKAHGFQIGKTCEVLAHSGADVELWYPYRKNEIKDSVFEYYGLEENFKLREISSFDVIRMSKYIGSLAFYIQTILFSLFLMFKRVDNDDIVFTRDIFIVFLFGLRGKKVVYNAHNWSSLKNIFSKAVSKKTPVVCNSNGTQEALQRAGFNKTVVMHNGVDVDDFIDLGTKESLRKRLSLAPEKKIVMYVGHLYQWKGIDVVLESSNILKDRKDILFVIVGGSTKDVLRYEEKTKHFENIIFTGHVLKKDVPAYMVSADVLLLPNTDDTEESVKYTSPIKMFEYMASGNPIIASNLSSIKEVLHDENAILVDPGNAIELADAIRDVVDGGGKIQARAKQALSDAGKFTWSMYGVHMMEFFRAI